MKIQNNKAHGLISYPVIAAAASGDIAAIYTVLKHYNRYIVKLSTRRFIDEYGQPHMLVDEELKNRLEAKLMMKILTFRVA